jgi:hypothetical protein
MKKETGPVLKKFSFGGCDVGNTSPSLTELSSATSVLNVRIEFEEALKLHLAIGECIRKLNTYKRSTTAGKRTALNIAIHLTKNRVTVNETVMPLVGSSAASQKKSIAPSKDILQQDMQKSKSSVATRKSFLNLPLPSEKAKLDARSQYSGTEFEIIRKGHVPVDDDKWFIYFDEKRHQLFFHRTWTGFCVYRVTLRPFSGGWEIAEAWVNRNSEQYESTDPTYDAAVLLWLIDVFLLNKERDFPSIGTPE